MAPRAETVSPNLPECYSYHTAQSEDSECAVLERETLTFKELNSTHVNRHGSTRPKKTRRRAGVTVVVVNAPFDL